MTSVYKLAKTGRLKEQRMRKLNEKRIIPVARPTGNQASVMAKIVAAATPELAAADISDTPNLSAARDMLIKLGMIEMNNEGAFLTDKGKDVMINQNLMTPDEQLTKDGQVAAYGEDEAEQAAEPEKMDFDLGLDNEMEPNQQDQFNVDLGNQMGEGFEFLQRLRETDMVKNLTKVPTDLLNQLSPTEQVSLSLILEGKEELIKFENLYHKLYSYFVREMPYGVAKARTGDPDSWIVDRLS